MDRRTEIQADRLADRQAYKQTDIYTYTDAWTARQDCENIISSQ